MAWVASYPYWVIWVVIGVLVLWEAARWGVRRMGRRYGPAGPRRKRAANQRSALDTISGDLVKKYDEVVAGRGRVADSRDRWEVLSVTAGIDPDDIAAAEKDLHDKEKTLAGLDLQLRSLERKAKREFPDSFPWLP